MKFHYLDRITHIDSKKAVGYKNATRNEPFYYWLPNGKRMLSPAVVCEGFAQLGSWLDIFHSEFTKRPVFLADEYTKYSGYAKAGDQIKYEVSVLERDGDVTLLQNKASINGKTIIEADCGRGYLLALEDFEDPEQVKRHFNHLYKPEHKDSVPLVANIQLPAIAGKQTWESLRFVDGIVEHIPQQKITGIKNVSMSEPYFSTHFPRKPVVPGVLLMSFIGELTQFLIKDSLHAPLRSQAVLPTYTKNMRFRKFVEPGDQCLIEIINKNPGEDLFSVDVKIFANEKRVMQAEMGFQIMRNQD